MSRRAVIVRLIGGLGNQLFQYAFGRSLSLETGAPLVLDSVSTFLTDHYRRSFELDRFSVADHCTSPRDFIRLPLPRWKHRLWHTWPAVQPLFRHRYVVERNPALWEPVSHRLHFSRPTYFDGYWQHDRYFRGHRDALLRELTLASPPAQEAKDLAGGIDPDRTVCVHVRCLRHAAAGVRENPRLDVAAQYYPEAISSMARRIDKPTFLVFSDYPEWTRANLSFPSSTVFLPDDGTRQNHEDIWLMSQCRYFIIGNSTFSWWAAWLSRDPDKYVIAPRSGLHNGLQCVPEDWHLV